MELARAQATGMPPVRSPGITGRPFLLAWRSLAARELGELEVPGSIPGVKTNTSESTMKYDVVVASGAPRKVRRTPDLERFQPRTPSARRTVDELVVRGAVVMLVRSSKVTLRRGPQTCVVDDVGRVQWAS